MSPLSLPPLSLLLASLLTEPWRAKVALVAGCQACVSLVAIGVLAFVLTLMFRIRFGKSKPHVFFRWCMLGGNEVQRGKD